MHAHKERCIHVCNVETRSGMIALADSGDDERTLIKASGRELYCLVTGTQNTVSTFMTHSCVNALYGCGNSVEVSENLYFI